MTESANRDRITRFGERTDHSSMMRDLQRLGEQYRFLHVHTLGHSLHGREIPCVRLGNEKATATVMYVGAHHGMEWITAAVLLRFIEDYCTALETGERIEGMNAAYLYRTRLCCIVPMLNPDGVHLQQNGADDAPNRDALIRMNRDSPDFSRWQANGRGVDLNHNYNAGFAEYKLLEAECGISGGAPTRYSGEYPESEPEVEALAAWLRCDPTLRLILTLHTQGEELYYTSGGICPPRGREIARHLAAMTGYQATEPEGLAAYGGLTDWAIRSLGCPSITVECGRGVNPLPASDGDRIYKRLREALFTALVMA